MRTRTPRPECTAKKRPRSTQPADAPMPMLRQTFLVFEFQARLPASKTTRRANRLTPKPSTEFRKSMTSLSLQSPRKRLSFDLNRQLRPQPQLVADEPEKLVGMITAVDRELTNLGKDIFLLFARDFLGKAVDFLQHRMHLLAIEDSVPTGVDVSEHRESSVSYGENAIQYSPGFCHLAYFLPV